MSIETSLWNDKYLLQVHRPSPGGQQVGSQKFILEVFHTEFNFSLKEMHNSSPSSHHKRRKRILEAVELIEEILKEYELEIVNDKE